MEAIDYGSFIFPALITIGVKLSTLIYQGHMKQGVPVIIEPAFIFDLNNICIKLIMKSPCGALHYQNIFLCPVHTKPK